MLNTTQCIWRHEHNDQTRELIMQAIAAVISEPINDHISIINEHRTAISVWLEQNNMSVLENSLVICVGLQGPL
jgi:hypothetical protein